MLSVLIVDLASFICGVIVGVKGTKAGMSMWQVLLATQFTSAACVGIYLVAR